MRKNVDRARYIRRGLAYFLILWALGAALFAGEHSAMDAWRIRRQRKRIEAELERYRMEAKRLQAVVDSLENIPYAIERVARERYGMIRDCERLIRFVDADERSSSVRSRVDVRP